MTVFAFCLLIFFLIKHFVADYILQNQYMLGKFKPDWSFALPLLAHASVHGCFTLFICLLVAPALWWLALVDIVTHFVIDRMKAGEKYLGRFKALSANEFKEKLHIMTEAHEYYVDLDHLVYDHNFDAYVKKLNDSAIKRIKSNTFFWWALGLDATLHQLVDLIIVAFIVGVL